MACFWTPSPMMPKQRLWAGHSTYSHLGIDLCALAVRLKHLIHNNTKIALVAYTSERLSVPLILNIIVLRLSRMQPRNDTFIYIVTHESTLESVWQIVNVMLQTLNIRWTINCPKNFHVVHKHNRSTWQQVMTAFKNEIPLTIRQGTVLHLRFNTNFACLKR